MGRFTNSQNSLEFEKIKKNSHHKTIESDFKLLYILLKDLLIYLVLFIPYLLAFLFSLLASKDEAQKYLSKLLLEPFKLIKDIHDWFFQAKWTAFLIIVLVFSFILQILFLAPFIETLMTHPDHLSQGNFLSILTSIFLHANPLHLFTNLLALLIFGRVVEKHLGMGLVFVFLGSGIIANVISNQLALLSSDLFYSLGASGAIAGLIMFAILFEPFAFTTLLLIPLPLFLIGWTLILIDLIGLTQDSSVNHFAHLGGYLALLVLFFFLEFKHRQKIVKGLILNVLILIVIFIALRFLEIV